MTGTDPEIYDRGWALCIDERFGDHLSSSVLKERGVGGALARIPASMRTMMRWPKDHCQPERMRNVMENHLAKYSIHFVIIINQVGDEIQYILKI